MKISNEQINFINPPEKEITKISSEEINKKYSRGEVRIITEQARYPLDSIKKMVESDDYKLDPDFQRRRRWSKDKQSLLIESFIINVPIPPIFLYEVSYSNYEVMDGLQRLTAIFEFYSDKFELEGLEQWPELNGFKYSELPEQIKKGIDRRYLSSIILLYETSKSVENQSFLKQMVFERINSGGEKLSAQESRNALCSGKLNDLTKLLSRNKDFRKLWGIPSDPDILLVSDKTEDFDNEELRVNKYYAKMYDVELVLRFFAYRQNERAKSKGLTALLDQYLIAGNNQYDEDTLKELALVFEKTVNLINLIFGAEAFWMYRKRKQVNSDKEMWSLYNKPTTTLYDCMMNVFSKNLDNEELILKNSKKISSGKEKFLIENYEQFEGRNVNETIVKKREKLFDEYIKSFLA